ncbi:Membrane protein involved in the export of O-antigen and teichoic acid [Halogranum rubrum]|uniref:Membrane protein involved in the export of O-antigen and teichoic acid n=1 Tax=Halogranum rubrum TaxID=553466 RepID=A0A1I4B9N2_9EURY|nr:flippase [Halogranum rubrum]SFK65485.1 Membrane protein involved in the export of O-antigen and teichoic acid [Halogranum rubrum]
MSDDNAAQTIFSGAAIVVIGLLISAVVGFGIRLVVARSLSTTDYGQFALGRSLLLSLGIFTVMGLHDGLGRYLPRTSSANEERGYIVSAVTMALGVSLTVATVGIIFANQIAMLLNQPDAATMLRVFLIGLPGLAAVRLAMGGMQGNERAFPRIFMEQITLPLSQLGLAALTIWLGVEAWLIGLGVSAGYLIAGAFGLGWLLYRTNLADRAIVPELKYRTLLAFSLPLVLSGMMFQVLTRMDIFLLSYFTGDSGLVGTYDVVYPLATQLTLLLTAAGFLTMPVLSRLDNEGDHRTMRETYSLITKWILLVTLPVAGVFIAFPDTIIRYTFGAKYLSGAVALQILALGFVTHTIVGPNGNVLKALGKPRLLLVCTVVTAAINTVLNVLLIPRYQLIGAALATTLSYGVFNFTVSGMLYREARLLPLSRRTLAVGAVGAGTFVGVYLSTKWLAVDGWQAILTVCLLFAPVYLTSLLLFGVTEAEIDLLNQVEKSIGRDLGFVRRPLERVTR